MRWRAGQEVSPEEGGYTSLVLPFPLPRGTTRHAAAYHPCQPSPPGNVAAFSATPSGVPAAPQNTAAGGGRGQRGRCPPRAREKRQVPLPQGPSGLEVGQGAGEGSGRCSSASGGSFKHSPTDGTGAVWAVPACPSPPACPRSTAKARSTGPPRASGFPPFPSSRRRGGPLPLLTSPPSSSTCPPAPARGGPRRRRPGRGRGTGTWLPIHLLPAAWHFGGK